MESSEFSFTTLGSLFQRRLDSQLLQSPHQPFHGSIIIFHFSNFKLRSASSRAEQASVPGLSRSGMTTLICCLLVVSPARSCLYYFIVLYPAFNESAGLVCRFSVFPHFHPLFFMKLRVPRFTAQEGALKLFS